MKVCAAALVFALSLVFAASASAGEYIVVLKDGVSEPAVASNHAEEGAEVSTHYRHALNGYAATLSDSELAEVRADPSVRFVDQDRKIKLPKLDAPAQVVARPVDRIDAELSSAVSGDGKGKVDVNVGVIDSGIDLRHKELNVRGGINCTPDGGGFEDVVGHGTAVAGLIGAQDDKIGVVGVVPGAPLWSARVGDASGTGQLSWIICGIDFMTATRADASKNNDVQVANISLGTPPGLPFSDDGNCGISNNDAVHMAICRSTAAGVTYVASAGNEQTDYQCCIPFAYDEVLTATAMGDYDGQPGGRVAPICRIGDEELDDSVLGQRDDQFAWFSNFATLAADQAHTIAAPGICIETTQRLEACAEQFKKPKVCYATVDGTSFSAPLTAGTVALCIASGPCAGLPPAQIIRKILDDAGRYNRANPGYGFIGDPLRPIPGKYYGYLIRAGLY